MDNLEDTCKELLETAVELAQRAGRLSLKWFSNQLLNPQTKSDGSLVTEADLATEEFMIAELQKLFPEDSIVGEEHGCQGGTSGRLWTIDPIDGTRSFVHGVPLFATLLAMMDSTGPRLGVTVIPALDEAVWAGRGLGAYHRSGTGIRPARVSSTSSLETACITTSGLEYLPAKLGAWLTQRRGVTRTWGDGYGYVLLATGRADIMIDPGLSLWDVAPMLVIVPEAGGCITTLDGGDVRLEDGNTAAEGAVGGGVEDGGADGDDRDGNDGGADGADGDNGADGDDGADGARDDRANDGGAGGDFIASNGRIHEELVVALASL